MGKSSIVLVFFLFVATTMATIKDFIIESEEDLQRFGQTGDVALSDEDLAMYDQCGSAIGSHNDDDDNYNDDIDVQEFLQKVISNGQINVAMMREALKRLSNDPRYASLMEGAQLEADNNFYDVAEQSSCQENDYYNYYYYNNNMEMTEDLFNSL